MNNSDFSMKDLLWFSVRGRDFVVVWILFGAIKYHREDSLFHSRAHMVLLFGHKIFAKSGRWIHLLGLTFPIGRMRRAAK